MNLFNLLISFGLLLLAMSVHECAHGWVAFKLGDNTAKSLGRLTLNPLAHIDPFGTVILPLLIFIASGGRFIFGAAKPVPINYLSLRNPRRDMLWIGLSGPVANLLFAIALSIVLPLFAFMGPVFSFILQMLIIINVVLGIFNLIPIPPLDGSRIVMGLLPRDLAYKYSRIEPYGFFIIMLLIMLGLFQALVWPMVGLILNLLGVGI